MAQTISGMTKRKLPKAPLVEAVFELRWALVDSPETPAPFRVDPGFFVTQEAFTQRAAQLGFPTTREMITPDTFMAAYGVSRRFFAAPDQEFPLLQIGPGIFATNQSAEYEWDSFKQQIIKGIKAVIASYPTIPNFPFTPNYLELRYVDAFDSSLVGSTDMVRFLEDGTTMKIDPGPFFKDNVAFGSEVSGRIILNRDIKKWKSSVFSVDIGSGHRKGEKIIRSEAKVVTKTDGVPKLSRPQTFLAEVSKWLEFAHGLTSEMFESFVKPAVMKKFEGVS